MKNRNFFSSLKYAVRGIFTLIEYERNFRFDCFAALAVAVFSFIFPLLKWERCVLYALCALVLSLEGLNSALERAVDLASPDIRPLAAQAKDTAAAAVLIAAIVAAIVGSCIFVPYFVDFLF